MYLKKPITEQALDLQRVNLSVMKDGASPDTPLGTPAHEQRLSPEPLCDWCGGPDPVTTYAASRMSNGDPRQCWRWNACAACERLVDKNHWDVLERRVTARFKLFLGARMEAQMGQVPEHVITEAVQSSLREFHDYAVRVMEAGGGKTSLREVKP